MKFVLLSGGSGQRLWPLSNDTRSKQFLKVLPREGSANLESMAQRVWRQLSTIGMNSSSYIATGKGQMEMIHSQLGMDVPVIVEPERRDTFPAIALAASYLHSHEDISSDEVIAVLPVDPFVETSFFRRVLDLEKLLNDSDAEIALLGVQPTYPSAKYGYIVPEAIHSSYIKVSHFKEKPDEKTAALLIENNALWNCGVFSFRLKFILDLLEKKGIPTEYVSLKNNYHLLEKISFDYAVLERAEHIVALPYEGYWKDLGTWNTLTEEMATSKTGNGMMSQDCRNTHIINELDIPVNVLGLNDVVVAASPNGILVTDKKASPRVKEVLKADDQRTMYEERRWGWYKVLDFSVYDQKEVLTKKILITKGKHLSYHSHNHREEVWTVLKGRGFFLLDNSVMSIEAGDVLKIPSGHPHSVKAIEELEIIEVQSGFSLFEEDIHRILLDWDQAILNTQTK